MSFLFPPLEAFASLSDASLSWSLHHGLVGEQVKLPASFVSPSPLYQALLGYGQSGRCMAIPLAGSSPTNFVATIWAGAARSSTQWVSAVTRHGPRRWMAGPGRQTRLSRTGLA